MQFYANECNEGETLNPNPNEYNSTLTSGTSGGGAPTYTIYSRGGVNYLTLRVQFYANECNEGRDAIIKRIEVRTRLAVFTNRQWERDNGRLSVNSLAVIQIIR